MIAVAFLWSTATAERFHRIAGTRIANSHPGGPPTVNWIRNSNRTGHH
jgi:hypothetical protein